MKTTFSKRYLENLRSKYAFSDAISLSTETENRSPVHVVYGGAHLFTAGTPQKLGAIALAAMEKYAPDFSEFARAMWLKGADALPSDAEAIGRLEASFARSEKKLKSENPSAWFALTVYFRTIEKLKREPVEDFRIDFEDGYGFRPDSEEDAHAVAASAELAKAFINGTITPFCGFRIKSFAPETIKRAVRTLDIFLTNLIEETKGELPRNFVVTLPKIERREEIEMLVDLLEDFERERGLKKGSIKIELVIETPRAIIDETGAIALPGFIEAGKERVSSAHFGAYDYTASFGITGIHQHLRHEACSFARQMMQIALAPLNVRLSDSVTVDLPIPVHKGEDLSKIQVEENNFAVHKAWRKHFNNVTFSQINGFYQSWDLHPAQLPARYAAVYAFFLDSVDEQAERLKNFIAKATQAMTTGNVFDDAASAEGLLNFFLRAINCGALSEKEVRKATGLSRRELYAGSFLNIMKLRRVKENS